MFELGRFLQQPNLRLKLDIKFEGLYQFKEFIVYEKKCNESCMHQKKSTVFSSY